MTSIPVNAFSAPHVRQMLQKQKLQDQRDQQSKGDVSSLLKPIQQENIRKSAPDSLEISHKSADKATELPNHQNLLDAFQKVISSNCRRDLVGRSISCMEPRMEIHIDIRDFSNDDIIAGKSPNTLSPDPEQTVAVAKKRFRFLSGQ